MFARYANARQHANAGAGGNRDTAQIDFKLKSCLPMAPALPIEEAAISVRRRFWAAPSQANLLDRASAYHSGRTTPSEFPSSQPGGPDLLLQRGRRLLVQSDLPVVEIRSALWVKPPQRSCARETALDPNCDVGRQLFAMQSFHFHHLVGTASNDGDTLARAWCRRDSYCSDHQWAAPSPTTENGPQTAG